MDQHANLSQILIFLAAAVILIPVFQRLRVSPILAYLVAGVIIGPSALSLVSDPAGVATLAEFGVMFLLFAIGLELSFARLHSLRREVLGLGSLQVLVTTIFIATLTYQLGMPIETAFIIGGALSFSSTAMVMQLLSERGESASRAGRSAFSVLLSQDLAVVPFMALIPMLAVKDASFGGTLLVALFKAVIALGLIFIIGRLFLRPLFRLIAGSRNRELFMGATLLIALGTGWLTAQVNLSMALGAFLAGLLLAETEYRHQVEGDIAPFRGLFLGLFFMSIGMSIDLAALQANAATILLLAIGLILGKLTVITLLCRGFRFPIGTSLHVGLLLAQGGEFAFVLFGLAMVAGLLPPATGQILTITVGLTMAVTPLLATLGRRLADKFSQQNIGDDIHITEAAGDLRNHVIICGFGRVGQTVARLMQVYDIPYIALDLDYAMVTEGRRKGYQVYYGNAAQMDVVDAAGAGRSRLVVVTLDQPHLAERIVRLLHHRHPKLQIIVRGRDREQSSHLKQVGATAVIPEALETSLQLSSLALRYCGIPNENILEALDRIRSEDYAPVVEIIAGTEEKGLFSISDKSNIGESK